MLESLALGMESGDMTQVLSASSKAQGLTADAEKVDAIGERLKAKYGI